ncbi:outer membrane immunogenic protein [Agrobacterium vitis]|nr:outer membrane immunogenic protein [Agrobacterium vitis]MBE1440313.1 outer membrane immunogenic protein [Agrobacterium vitis]
MIKTFLLTTVAALFASTSMVMAADAVDEIPTAPTAVNTPAFSWAGGYVGVHGGYGWLDATLSQGSTSFSDDFDGGRIGGFAGWNFDVGHNVILGVEGDLNYDWNDNDYFGVKVGTDVSGSVRARAGYAIDHALLFVTGGWTAQRGYIESSVGDFNETFNGWTVGAGVDYAVTKNIFTRAEYRYNDFGSKNFSGLDFDTKQHVINIGVGVKF